MARALVTGASGFIGYHLVNALVERGDEVTCLVRPTSNVSRIEPLGVELAHGDVTDPHGLSEVVAGQDTVYHVAGLIAAFGKNEHCRVNEGGVRSVAAACAESARPPVLVVVSSLAAAGPAQQNGLRREEDDLNPVSNYGRSKRAGELAAETFSDRVPTTVVRPPIVFGEADTNFLDVFLAIKRTRLHFAPSLRPRKFSFIHAADLARLLLLAADRGERLASPDGEHGGRGYYFADSGEHPTYHELGPLIGQAMGLRHAISVPCPSALVWSIAALSGAAGRLRGKPASLCIDKAREATAGSWACSGEKAAQDLGFSAGKPLVERFRQTVEWYRREGWL